MADPDPNLNDGHAASDDALARGEGGVDQVWYIATNPDVAAAGIDPVAHYLQFGWREGRDPRRDFSTLQYIADHEDIAMSAENPFIHYLRAKSSAHPDTAHWQIMTDDEVARTSVGVDRQWYLEADPDIAAAGIDPVCHYMEFGWREGRDPRRNFSTSGYLAINREVARAGINPFIYYLRHGGPKGPRATWRPGVGAGCWRLISDG